MSPSAPPLCSSGTEQGYILPNPADHAKVVRFCRLQVLWELLGFTVGGNGGSLMFAAFSKSSDFSNRTVVSSALPSLLFFS